MAVISQNTNSKGETHWSFPRKHIDHSLGEAYWSFTRKHIDHSLGEAYWSFTRKHIDHSLGEAYWSFPRKHIDHSLGEAYWSFSRKHADHSLGEAQRNRTNYLLGLYEPCWLWTQRYTVREHLFSFINQITLFCSIKLFFAAFSCHVTAQSNVSYLSMKIRKSFLIWKLLLYWIPINCMRRTAQREIPTLMLSFSSRILIFSENYLKT